MNNKQTDQFLSRYGIPSIQNHPVILRDWLLNEMIFLGMTGIYVTLLTGHRYNLITESMHENVLAGYSDAYTGGKDRFTKIVTQCYDMNAFNKFSPNFPLNEDFEVAIKLIRHGRRLNQNILQFLHKKLNRHQLEMEKEKNEFFLQSFTGHRSNLSDAYRYDDVHGTLILSKEFERENPNFFEEREEYFDKLDMVTDDPDLIFMNCICLRQSFQLKCIME